MKTTEKNANIIYQIIKSINPFEVSDLDKKDYIKSIKKYSLENNIKKLKKYIKDNDIDIAEDKNTLKMYNNLISQANKKRASKSKQAIYTQCKAVYILLSFLICFLLFGLNCCRH